MSQITVSEQILYFVDVSFAMRLLLEVNVTQNRNCLVLLSGWGTCNGRSVRSSNQQSLLQKIEIGFK